MTSEARAVRKLKKKVRKMRKKLHSRIEDREGRIEVETPFLDFSTAIGKFFRSVLAPLVPMMEKDNLDSILHKMDND